MVSTNPTTRGKEEIDAFHPLYGLHYLTRKSVHDFFQGEDRTHWLRIEKGKVRYAVVVVVVVVSVGLQNGAVLLLVLFCVAVRECTHLYVGCVALKCASLMSASLLSCLVSLLDHSRPSFLGVCVKTRPFVWNSPP